VTSDLNNRNVRAVCSLLWVLLLLIPPVRYSLEAFAIFVWPSIAPFSYASHVQAFPVPFMVLIVVGYLLTLAALLFLARNTEGFARCLSGPGQSSLFNVTALAGTLAWLAILALLGQAAHYHFVIAFLVVIAFIPIHETTPAPPPQPPPVSPGEEEPEPGDSEDATSFNRTYSWLFKVEPYRVSSPERRFSISLSIPRKDYEDLRGRDHHVSGQQDFVKFANAQLGDGTVKTVSSRLREICRKNGYDQLAEIHLTMSFTLSMSYVSDAVEHAKEYPKFPVEMLVDKKGDCEDFSILCSTLLRTLGYRTAIILMSIAGKPHGHAAMGIVSPSAIPVPGFEIYSPAMGTNVTYCEVTPSFETTKTTTRVQWWMGMPPSEEAHDFKVYPLD